MIPAYYFDILGILAFTYLLFAFYRLMTKKELTKKHIVVGFLIALIGFILDLIIVINNIFLS